MTVDDQLSIMGAAAQEISEGIASCARTVALASPDNKLGVFKNQVNHVSTWVRRGFADKHLVVDSLQDIASSNGLVDTHGQDAIQKILAAGFAQAVTTCNSERSVAKPSNGYSSKAPQFASGGRELPSGLVFDVVADVEAQAIDWVWPGRLARRKLTLIAGDPGLGKSQITADIAARLSANKYWPDGGRAPSGSTIILSAEDSVGDTLRPRLEVADADLRRIHALRAVVGTDGQRRTFSLQGDLILLGNKLKTVADVAVVIIDPITSYMGKIDSHRTTDVRAVLEPVAEFADLHNVSVLAITHPPKATQAKALHAITGSLAFVAAARLVFIAVEEADTDRRLLLPVKSNIAAMPPGIGFSLVQATTAGGIVTSHVVWDAEPVSITANQALHAAAETAKGDGAVREAEEFIQSALADGPVSVRQIEKEAAGLGISKPTLKRARNRLHVVAEKDGFRAGWLLRLPSAGGQ